MLRFGAAVKSERPLKGRRRRRAQQRARLGGRGCLLLPTGVCSLLLLLLRSLCLSPLLHCVLGIPGCEPESPVRKQTCARLQTSLLPMIHSTDAPECVALGGDGACTSTATAATAAASAAAFDSSSGAHQEEPARQFPDAIGQPTGPMPDMSGGSPAAARRPPSTWRPSSEDIAAGGSSPVLLAAHPGLPYQLILSGDPCCLPINSST